MPLADTPGVLVVDPPTGKDFTTPSLAAKDGAACPAGTAQLLTRVVGPTAEWQAVLVIWTVGTYSGGPVAIEAGGISFTGLATSNSLPLVAGRYQVITECVNADSVTVASFAGDVFFTDTTNYVTSDPTTTTLPVSFAGVTPAQPDRLEIGQTTSLTATLDQATAAGTIQFKQRVGNDPPTDFGSPVAVADGAASVTLANLPVGVSFFSAVFTPTDSARFTTATSSETAYASVPPLPPTPPDSAAIGAGLSGGVAKVGVSLSCTASGSFTGATTTGYRWRRDFVLIDGATSQSYAPTADDVGHQLQCEATGTKTVASTDITSGRISSGVEVQS